MNYKEYIKNGKLILPKGFNSKLDCSWDKLTELILPEGFNNYLYCDNKDLNKIANCMEEFKLNYFNAGIKIIDKLELNKLPKLKSYHHNLKLNIILNDYPFDGK